MGSDLDCASMLKQGPRCVKSKILKFSTHIVVCLTRGKKQRQLMNTREIGIKYVEAVDEYRGLRKETKAVD
jgi:hypothetical protein